MRTVIIDDEPKSRELIAHLLSVYCSEVSILAMAEDVKSGLKVIRQHRPDLVLLDIRLPDGTGFDLLRQIGKVDFMVIFITAYEQYALKAIKFNALEYLLKPIDPEELTMAISKAMKTFEKESYFPRIQKLLDQMDQSQRMAQNRKLILRTQESIHVVNTTDIIAIESDRNYSIFYLVSKEKIVISRTIKEFILALQDLDFYRIHNSYIVNLHHIKKLKREELMCLMSDGSEVPVSSRKREELIHLLESLQ